VKTLPNGKLPDRNDFQRYLNDVPGRARDWLRAVREGERLRDEFREACARQTLDIQAL
jgi:hypothetical protein